MEKLESMIQDQCPGVLFLQEMGHGPSIELYQRIKELYQRIKDLYPHFFVRLGPNPPLMESALFVASRHPILNADFIPFDKQTSILRGAFWIETDQAVIFTAHMEHGDTNNPMRLDQLQKIKDKMAEFDKPCFLLGDLNIDRYAPGQYEESGIAKDFHDPIPANTPTCSNKLEQVMRNQKISPPSNEQTDYALLRKKEYERPYLNVEILDTYDENQPHDATSDHKAVVLTADLHDRGMDPNWWV